jgi:hypothetical protein
MTTSTRDVISDLWPVYASGEATVGRLSLPSVGFTNVLVIDVPGSGPNTYENRRRIGRTTELRCHDLFAAEFARRGVAYFSYNTRHTEVDENVRRAEAGADRRSLPGRRPR